MRRECMRPGMSEEGNKGNTQSVEWMSEAGE